jgi:L-asparaginase II
MKDLLRDIARGRKSLQSGNALRSGAARAASHAVAAIAAEHEPVLVTIEKSACVILVP